MRVLITGAGGQLGQSLQTTAPNDVTLTTLTRAQCDITDGYDVERQINKANPDLVFNCAAYTAVDAAEEDQRQARALNLTAVANLSKFVVRNNARLVHVSTDFVFDGTAGHAYRPDDTPNPLSIYGLTKREGELAALECDPRCLVVRTAWIYSSTGANFVNTMLRLMREREEIRVVADQVGTPTYAPSLANAIWELAIQGVSGIHHYTDSGVASWYDFAVAIQEEALAIKLLPRAVPIIPITTADYPTRAIRPAYSVLDKSPTWAKLGWNPPHWRVNLRTMLREIKANG